MRSLTVACVLAVVAESAAYGRVPAAPPDSTAAQATPSLDYDIPPKPLRITRPEYPPERFEQGLEGTVELEILIDAHGRVALATVVKSIPRLDGAALACVKRWRFKPAQKAGKPVPTIARAPISFRRDAKSNTKA